MDHGAGGRITECPLYVSVDFESGSLPELSATYRSFAELCIGKQVSRALLKAGDNDPQGHRLLRDTLCAMARSAAIPQDFKLALVPSTPAIHRVYREAQQALRAVGLNAWIFDTACEAVEWLEGRAACGQTVS